MQHMLIVIFLEQFTIAFPHTNASMQQLIYYLLLHYFKNELLYQRDAKLHELDILKKETEG